MNTEQIKSRLLHAALFAYNGVIVLIINPLLWAYGLWSERRWTPPQGLRTVSSTTAPRSFGLCPSSPRNE